MAVKSLNKYWAYATRADLGETTSDIAKLFGVTINATKYGIKSLARELPPASMVPKQFRERVSRYRAKL